MKAKFKMISTILIILLAILLIAVLIGYYNEPVEVVEPNINNIADANQEINKVISENVSGEVITNDVVVSGEIIDLNSGELAYNNSGEADVPVISNPPKAEDDSKKDTAVIITSEDTMTNKEKREILTELDNALMDLLDVVDKVQVVDESRLVTDDGEVQE